MISSIFDQTNIPVLQEVLSFSEARHKVLAGNIANADTPGYQVRELSPETFQERLREAIQTRARSRESLASGLSNSQPGDEMRRVRESTKSILFLDDSDVGIEQQVTEVAKNQFMHNMTVAIMRSQFRLLETAISERI